MARLDVVVRYGCPYVRRARLTAVERDEHGTLARFMAGCRCTRCRRARQTYDRERRAALTLLAGRREAVWKVSTKAARAHVGELRARGWTVACIASAAGVSAQTVRRVLRVERCWNLTSSAILAVGP